MIIALEKHINLTCRDSETRYIIKFKLLPRLKNTNRHNNTISLKKMMSTTILSLKINQSLVFFSLKTPKLELILVSKHPRTHSSSKTIVAAAAATPALYIYICFIFILCLV